MTDFYIDTRGLEPPEPFQRTKEIILSLTSGDSLTMLHRRIPFPLLDACNSLNISYEITELADSDYEITFKK